MPYSLQEFKAAFSRLDDSDQSQSNAVELISRHVKIVSGLQHTDPLSDLNQELVAARAVLAKLRDVDDKVVQSHLKTLEDELPPLDRLIKNAIKEDAKDKKMNPTRNAIRKALVDGDLATKMQDGTFRGEFSDWLDTIDDPAGDTKKEIIKAFRAIPETETDLRENAFKKAFNCTLGVTKNGSAEHLPPKVLNKVLDSIEALPKEHLPKGWDFVLYEGFSTSGGAWDTDNEIAKIQFGLDDAPDFDEPNAYAAVGDPLEGTSYFESVISHELGHACDTRNGGNLLTATSAGGGWQTHGTNPADIITAISTLANDFAGELHTSLRLTTRPTVSDVQGWFGAVQASKLGREDDFKADFAQALKSSVGDSNIGVLDGVTSWSKKKTAVSDALPMTHDFVKVIIQAFRDNPSLNIGTNPIDVGGRVYIWDTSNGWYSYDRSAWDAKVSKYQYAAPGEWFAEFYVAANNTEPGIRKKAESAYPDAYKWMGDKGLLMY